MLNQTKNLVLFVITVIVINEFDFSCFLGEMEKYSVLYAVKLGSNELNGAIKICSL